MAQPPDTLRTYIEHYRSSYRRFPPPHTVAALANVLQGWEYHRSHVAPDDKDQDAALFFRCFTDYVQMKTGVFSSRYWGWTLDNSAGGTDGDAEANKVQAHAHFYALYDSFWDDAQAGRALRKTPPPDGRYD
ncbi:MAG: hypothetical protein AB8B88_06910 [Devosiaceae bacterium]